MSRSTTHLFVGLFAVMIMQNTNTMAGAILAGAVAVTNLIMAGVYRGGEQ